MNGRILVLACAIAPALACQDGEFTAYPELDEECPAARLQDDGACCPAWAEAEGTRCTLRPWAMGSQDDAFGPVGARAPALAVDGGGRAVLAWAARGDAGSVLVVAEEIAEGHLGLRDPAAGFAGEAMAPAVAADASGRAAIVWRQLEDGEGRIHQSVRAATGGWRDPTAGDALSWAGDADAPRVVFGPGAETIAAWSQRTGGVVRIVVSRRQGDDVDLPVIVSPPLHAASAPAVAVAANGDAVVTWMQAGRTGAPTVLASERLRGGGEWTRPGPSDALSPPGAVVASLLESSPVAAIDRRGGIAIAWTQPDGTGAAPILLATRDGLGEWTAPESPADAFSDPQRVASGLRVAIGPAGQRWMAWSEDLGDVHRVVAAVQDTSAEWIEDGRAPAMLSALGADASEPALAVGPSGEVVVVFVETHGEVRRIVARRRHAEGTRWLDSEVLSDAASGDASDPTVAIGPSGRTVAAWVQGPPQAGQVRIAWVD